MRICAVQLLKQWPILSGAILRRPPLLIVSNTLLPLTTTLNAHPGRSASFASSIVFEKDMAKLLDVSVSCNQSASGKENLSNPPGLDSPKDVDIRHTISRVKSQPKVSASKSATQKARRGPAPHIGNLPPIMASPPTSPNLSRRTDDSKTRRPLGQVQPGNQHILRTKPSLEKRKSRILTDLSGATGPKKAKGKENTANQRVREWEREKQRLREMQRLEELERERDEELREKQAVDDLEQSLIALTQAAEASVDMLSTIEQSIPGE